MRKIGANKGAKYLKMIFLLLTFAKANILIYGLYPIAKLSLRIIRAIPIQPVQRHYKNTNYYST